MKPFANPPWNPASFASVATFRQSTQRVQRKPTLQCFRPRWSRSVWKQEVPLVPSVLDPFFGAGTVGVVALQSDRNCVGIELKPEYAAIAQKRVDSLNLMLPLRSTVSY